MKTQWHNNWLM